MLLSLACWLMLERRLCVYNVGLKVDVSREILTVVMMSYYENVCSSKRHTAVCHTFYFGDSLCSFLASWLTTVSLDICDQYLEKSPIYGWITVNIWFLKAALNSMVNFYPFMGAINHNVYVSVTTTMHVNCFRCNHNDGHI